MKVNARHGYCFGICHVNVLGPGFIPTQRGHIGFVSNNLPYRFSFSALKTFSGVMGIS